MMPNLALVSALEQLYERRLVKYEDFSVMPDGALPSTWTNNFAWNGWLVVLNGGVTGGGSGMSDTGCYRYAASSFLADQYVRATVSGATGYSGRGPGIWVRVSDDNDQSTDTTRDGYGLLLYDSGGNQCDAKVVRVVNGVITTLFGWQNIGDVVAGGTFDLQIIGTKLTARVNDKIIFQTDDSALTTGRPGIGSTGINNNNIYNIVNVEVGSIAPITPNVPLLKVAHRRTRTSQPYRPVELASRFATKDALVLLPTAEGMMNAVGKRLPWKFYQQFAGAIPVRNVGDGLRVYSDHAGNDDDKLQAPFSIPTGRDISVNKGAITTIIRFRAIDNGNTQVHVLNSSPVANGGYGHVLLLSQTNSNVKLGYDGGNGYARSGEIPINPFDGKWHTYVISSAYGQEVSISVDGSDRPATLSGLVSYIGGGLNLAETTPIIGGEGFTNYYCPNGTYGLISILPGVFLSQEETRQVALNPWQIFVPKRNRIMVAGVEPAPKPLTVRRVGRRSLTTQPTLAPSIDWSNPITKGLKFLALPFGASAVDLVSGAVAARSGNGYVRSMSLRDNGVIEREYINPDATGHLYWTARTRMDEIAGPYSIFVQARPINDAQDVLNAGILLSADQATGHGVGLLFDDGAYALDGIGRFLANSYAGVGDWYSVGVDSYKSLHRIAIAHDGTTLRAYTRGVLNTGTRTEGTPQANANRVTRIFGSHQGTAYVCAFSLAAAWDRPISLTEYRSLYVNPWQLFTGGDREFSFEEALQQLASQYPTLSLAQLINILTTQATPRVTITVP